ITFVVLFPVILVSVGLFEKYRATRPRIPNTEMQGIEIDKKKYPITGIDISKHTGKVDFKKAKEEKMDFVYLKASEGISLVDKQLENYYKSAKEQALPVGFYHFFIFGTDGEKQADNFIHSIADKKTDLPYVIDVED